MYLGRIIEKFMTKKNVQISDNCTKNYDDPSNRTTIEVEEFTLPTKSPVGSKISLIGKHRKRWKVLQNTDQYIIAYSKETTKGTWGYIESSYIGSNLNLECIEKDKVWVITNETTVILQ